MGSQANNNNRYFTVGASVVTVEAEQRVVSSGPYGLVRHPMYLGELALRGALLMGVINNGLDLLNVSSYYQQIVKGVIIVGAVWLDRNRGK